MSWLLQTFGSKKLVAALAAVLAAFLVPLAHRWLGLSLDPATVATTVGAVVGPLVLYIAAQWHIDIATDGQSTTAYQLTKAAALAAAATLPAQTIGAHVATALAQVLADPQAAAQLATAVAAKVPTAVPPSAPSP